MPHISFLSTRLDEQLRSGTDFKILSDWPLDEAIDLLEKASKIGWNGIKSKANMAQELGSKVR